MAKSYDRLTGIYQLLEKLVFANSLHKARIAHIDHLKNAKTILILGEGDGRFLKELLELNPSCHVDCLDKSNAMLIATQERLKKENIAIHNINFIHADALDHSYPAKSYDAIVSLFFLDNFKTSQLEALIPKLVSSLKQDGKWFVADFQQPQKGMMKYVGLALLWIMYRFFRWQTDISARALVSPQIYLLSNLHLETKRTFLSGLLYSEVWSLPFENSLSTHSITKQKNDVNAFAPTSFLKTIVLNLFIHI